MINEKLQNSIFYNFNELQNQVRELRQEVADLTVKYDRAMATQRCHMMRIKNGEKLSDEYILTGKLYNDYSPEAAYEFYTQYDQNYILLDITEKNFQAPEELPEVTRIPFSELAFRVKEIVNKAIPILVISEDGVNSILACEMLNRFGYYNVNNVSGGYKFWPAFRQKTAPNIQSVA